MLGNVLAGRPNQQPGAVETGGNRGQGGFPQGAVLRFKLKNTLRWMMGEDLITHLGQEYYD